MVASMAVPPDVENEQRESPNITLDALDQAASKAEQAAQRLKVSSATPFNQLAFEAEYPGWSSSAHCTSSASSSRQVSVNGTSATFNQLAFEAEYPEWSLSAHCSSSASKSRRASANGTSTPFPGSSVLSEKDSIPASTDISPSAQNYTSSSDPIEAVTIEPEKLRKMFSKERGYTPSDKRQGLKPKSSGHSAGLDAHTRAGLQAFKTHPSFPRNSAQHSCPPSRPSTAARSDVHAVGFSNSPSSLGETDTEIIMQYYSGETPQALAPETNVDGISSSFTSEDQAQDETPWLRHREAVDSIIQSLNSRYEELYPNLKNSAIRQEVC
ncbi:hypothetical protein G7Y79_00001g003230 [Physcia stellaris]|nr:hypothetical protein G7Y79_00001g003230 [Physcia stellaris]